jgi:hypothetical protein
VLATPGPRAFHDQCAGSLEDDQRTGTTRQFLRGGKACCIAAAHSRTQQPLGLQRMRRQHRRRTTFAQALNATRKHIQRICIQHQRPVKAQAGLDHALRAGIRRQAAPRNQGMWRTLSQRAGHVVVHALGTVEHHTLGHRQKYLTGCFVIARQMHHQTCAATRSSATSQCRCSTHPTTAHQQGHATGLPFVGVVRQGRPCALHHSTTSV